MGCGHAADASQPAPVRWFCVLITAAATAAGGRVMSTPLGRDQVPHVINDGRGANGCQMPYCRRSCRPCRTTSSVGCAAGISGVLAAAYIYLRLDDARPSIR